MNKDDKTSEEKQNESLPPNISWPDVLEEKLTPSEDTTGKWVASTTSFERKGLRFGMESSPASVDVKGSMQAEERERKSEGECERENRKRWKKAKSKGRGGYQSQTTTREGKHAKQIKSRKQMSVERWWRRNSLPAHAVAAGSPVVPACMEGWKVDCRSKRSLSIFTALWRGNRLVNKPRTQPRKLLECSAHPGLSWQ